MNRRPLGALALSLLAGCGGGMSILMPLVPTPENAVPHAPPSTSVAAAEIPWPSPTTRVLANGLTAVVVERPRDHQISIRLRVLGAGESGTDAESGVPALVAMMLRRGSYVGDATEVSWPASEVVDDATYSVGVNHSEIAYVLRPDRLEGGLAALYAEEAHPAFDPEWFALEREQQLGSISSYQANPSEQAIAVLATSAFGRDNPFGRSTYGSRAVVARTHPPDLAAFHASHHGPDRSVIVVAGPVEAEATFALIERTFAAWEPIGGAATRYEASLVPDGPRLLFVDRAADHAQLFFAIPYRIASDEDAAAFDVLSDLYGGVFDSWLNLALREDDGSLYGASASRLGTYSAGLLVTSVSIAIDDVEGVVRRLDTVGARLASGRVEARELPLVQRQQTASYIDSFGSSGSTSRTIADGFTRGGGLEGIRRRHELAAAMTPETLAVAAGRVFDGSRTRLLVVGPRTELAPAVARARAE